MAVTAAQARQALRNVACQEGELAGNRQGKEIQRGPLRKSVPNGSFDGHYNFVSTHHV
jgi:hypothetical protein